MVCLHTEAGDIYLYTGFGMNRMARLYFNVYTFFKIRIFEDFNGHIPPLSKI